MKIKFLNWYFKPLLVFPLLVLAQINSNGQILYGYEKIDSIRLTFEKDPRLITDYMVDVEKGLLLIQFDFKATSHLIVKLSNFEVLQSFETPGHSIGWSYHETKEIDSDHIFIQRSSNKFYSLNLITGEVAKVGKDIKEGLVYRHSFPTGLYLNHMFDTQFFYYNDLAFEFHDNLISVFKQGLN